MALYTSMTKVKPFRGVRPEKGLVQDLMFHQFDHVILEKSGDISIDEIDARAEKLGFDMHTDPQLEYFLKVGIGYRKMVNNKMLHRDTKPCFYLFGINWQNHWLYGLAGAVHYSDYWDDVVKKHESTLQENEQELVKITEAIDFNFNPITLTYPDYEPMDKVVEDIVRQKESYSFLNMDAVEHKLWVIEDEEKIKEIEKHFSNIPQTYIADGHHRIESGSIVAKKRNEKGTSPAEAPHNYFVAIHFPSSQLRMYEFNRLLKDLGIYSPSEFVDELKGHFEVELSSEPVRPAKKFEFGLYIEKKWYRLSYKHATLLGDDPVDNLDVIVLRKEIMTRLLGIIDFRTTKRISYLEGVKGIDKLVKLVDRGDYAAAFTLYQTQVDELFAIADLHEVMPPKATCIEPKLKSGMISRLLS